MNSWSQRKGTKCEHPDPKCAKVCDPLVKNGDLEPHECDPSGNHFSIDNVVQEMISGQQEHWLTYPERIMEHDFRVVSNDDRKAHFWNGIDHSFCFSWARSDPNTCKPETRFHKCVPPHVTKSMFCKSC